MSSLKTGLILFIEAMRGILVREVEPVVQRRKPVAVIVAPLTELMYRFIVVPDETTAAT
jgi:hypothetical protein